MRVITTRAPECACGGVATVPCCSWKAALWLGSFVAACGMCGCIVVTSARVGRKADGVAATSPLGAWFRLVGVADWGRQRFGRFEVVRSVVCAMRSGGYWSEKGCVEWFAGRGN
eukprot:2267504-Prymnesium_polylepis.1